jgi:hypothetical protein
MPAEPSVLGVLGLARGGVVALQKSISIISAVSTLTDKTNLVQATPSSN